MNETVDRVPMSDWLHKQSNSSRFRARSVGIFIKMLEESLNTILINNKLNCHEKQHYFSVN